MTDYVPPKVWKWNAEFGGRFASINRPIAGPTSEKILPVGKHPLQLYSMGTPNGVKVTVMLEELLAAGHAGAEYDAWLISIMDGDQFSSGYVDINPNSKIPVMVDHSVSPPQRIFESGAILLYLAAKTGRFLPTDLTARYEVLEWLMFQMGGVGPMLGQAHHFRIYAPEKIPYAIDRYTNEAKRLYGVMNKRLAKSKYMAGSEYTIADIAIFPWLRSWKNQGIDWVDYPHLKGWFDEIAARPAVKRGVEVLASQRKPLHDDKARETLFGGTQYQQR